MVMDRNPEEGIEIMCDTNIYLSPVPKEFEDIDVGDPIDEDLLDDFLNEFTKYYPKFELVTEIYLEVKDDDECKIQFTSTDLNMESDSEEDHEEKLKEFLKKKYGLSKVSIDFNTYEHTSDPFED